ncbi:hypothetical protein T07_12 [Trichinella nelsoni]|uniref:Uncharacterized protein n=1 Tax=Trichinella nelsoni TaxID=6336 RepID=A0A0V0RC39_9BILA|nr:hypothetical protein T07_12 [Trichinella nelsoni]
MITSTYPMIMTCKLSLPFLKSALYCKMLYG